MFSDDDELRDRIIEAASEVFAAHGYGGTRVRMVAKRAGVQAHTVKRLTGGKAQLFGLVMSRKVRSVAADQVEAAADDPVARPALASLLAAARQVYTAPDRSWDILELEALTSSNRDADVRAIERVRMDRRRANIQSLFYQMREVGGIDPNLDEDALIHLALALSAGLATIHPVADHGPTPDAWDALMARLLVSMAPSELLLADPHGDRAIWRVRVDVPNLPGGMGRLVRALGALHGHTVGMQMIGTGDGHRTVDLAVTAPENVTRDDIRAAALSAGRRAFVVSGDSDDIHDLTTSVLDDAAEMVTNPSLAPLIAGRLLEADWVEVGSPTEGDDDRANVLRLQWTADRHVVLERSWAPFAKAERTRASALLRLAAAISAASGESDALGWIEKVKDASVWIRLAHPGDADAVAEMHQRCSEQSRYQRYISVAEWRDVQLHRLSGGHRGVTLVAMSSHGTIVALGNVFPESVGDSTTAEVAVLVEDDYHGRGLGTIMIGHLLDMAHRMKFTSVVATVLAENDGMLHVLAATGLTWTTSIESGVATMRADLDGWVPLNERVPEDPPQQADDAH